MHVIGHDRELMYVPAIDLAAFVHEVGEPSDELSVEDFPSILRHEDDVVQTTVYGVTSTPEDGFWHACSLYRNGRRDLAYPPR